MAFVVGLVSLFAPWNDVKGRETVYLMASEANVG
jgi:hypothetical protein